MPRSTMASSLLALLVTVSATYASQMGPFGLSLQSSTNSTLNGATLAACHNGAGIETFCLTKEFDIPASQFYFNQTSEGADSQGLLVFNLPINDNSSYVSQTVTLQAVGNNVVIPVLESGAGNVVVAFDGSGFLKVVSNSASLDTASSNWQLCYNNFDSYMYYALSLLVGAGPAANPTCQSVQVKMTSLASSSTTSSATSSTTSSTTSPSTSVVGPVTATSTVATSVSSSTTSTAASSTSTVLTGSANSQAVSGIAVLLALLISVA